MQSTGTTELRERRGSVVSVVYASGLITRGQKGYAEDLAGAASVGTVSRFMAEEFSTTAG